TTDASWWRRLGTFAVDFYLGFLWLNTFVDYLILTLLGERGRRMLEANTLWAGLALSVAVFSLYYIALEAAFSRTLGKLVFRTKVVSESGGPPSIRQIILRTLCRLIPFEPLSCLDERGWHDSIPRVRVVQSKA